MRNRVSKAFTLVEILIVVVILGILAAIVIPQFTNASADAQVGNVETQLQTIRSQIELYRVRNNGTYPAFIAGDSWAAAGMVNDNYLRTAPVNPRTGTTTIVMSGDPGVRVASGEAGWWYDGAGNFGCNGFNEGFRSQSPVGNPWYDLP